MARIPLTANTLSLSKRCGCLQGELAVVIVKSLAVNIGYFDYICLVGVHFWTAHGKLWRTWLSCTCRGRYELRDSQVFTQTGVLRLVVYIYVNARLSQFHTWGLIMKPNWHICLLIFWSDTMSKCGILSEGTPSDKFKKLPVPVVGLLALLWPWRRFIGVGQSNCSICQVRGALDVLPISHQRYNCLL